MPTLGRYGRRPAKNNVALRFADIRDAVAPDHVKTYDTSLSGWKMLGNGPDDSVFPGFQGAGVCGPVNIANNLYVVTGGKFYPDWSWVLELYKTQNPHFDPHSDTNGPGSAADGGVDLQTLCEHLVKVGTPDGRKALCFAKVDHTDPEEIDAAVAALHGVTFGVEVSQANEQQFSQNLDWDGTKSQIEGGHAVFSPGYDELHQLDRFVTWGVETGFTYEFLHRQLEECWAIVWPEHVVGLSQTQRAALDAQFYAITGGHIDFSSVPTPTTGDPSAELATALTTWLAAPHSSPKNKALIAPAQAWLASRTGTETPE